MILWASTFYVENSDKNIEYQEPSPRSQSGNLISLDIVATDAENLKAVEAIVEQFKARLQEAGARWVDLLS